jgi:oxaloacetate decarboxylase gamma subunit
MEVNLVAESLKFMVLGISVVFAFLTLLVGVLIVQGWVARRFFPEKHVSSGTTPAVGGTAAAGGDNLAAVIMAAISMHRKKRKS